MKYSLLFLLLVVTLSGYSIQYTVQGHIYQKGSNESLLSAHCTDIISGKATISNTSGFYSFTLPEGKVSINASYIGYSDSCYTFQLTKDTLLDIYLREKSQQVGEIVVVAKQPIHEQTILGKKTLPIKELQVVPSFLGETDILKALTIIPGITTGREGRSDLYVRGGDRGQNLFLLDGAKLYNTNHLGGFFSLFNPNVIKQVDVYKSGFPARYGGRASSVIEIFTRDGNREHFEGKFSLGLLSSGVELEGPLTKKVSILLAARTSYFDLYTLPMKREIKIYGEGSYFTFRFYDVNLKLSYFINQRNKFFINYFLGNDVYDNIEVTKTSSKSGRDSTLYKINNNCLTIGDNLSLGNKLFLKNSISLSNYLNKLDIKSYLNEKNIIDRSDYQSSSTIKEYSCQSRLEYYPSEGNMVKGGAEYCRYSFSPGRNFSYQQNSATGFEKDTSLGYFNDLHANELSIYGEDDFGFRQQLFVNLGIRGTAYFCSGRSFYRAEPRLSIRAKLNDWFSIKGSYTLMNQFNHVVVSNFGLFEKEMWISSTKSIPPQKASQFSLGVFSSVEKMKLTLSAEVYYKKMKNLLEFRQPSEGDIVVTDLDSMLIKDGIGEAYGAEFEVKWETGDFSSTLGYVLSWNNRRFDRINNGKWYPFIYDRRHDFSCLMTYRIGKHYSMSSNFVFATGTPYTLPEGYVKENKYMYGYYVYSGVNNRRLPNYHRLDLSIIKKEKTRRGNSQSFSLNIYNAYAHQNPVMIYYDKNTGKVYQKSMFSIVPTISYTLEF